MKTPPAIEIAAEALHDFELAHHHIQEGRPPLEDGRYKSWAAMPESARRSKRWLAQKALSSDTFEEFYGWTTLAERQMGHEVPEAGSDTERTRGARAQYFLLQHLLRIDEAAIAPSVREGQA